MSEQEQALLMAEKSDDDLIKYAESHISIDSNALISELLWRWKMAKGSVYHLEGKLTYLSEKNNKKVVKFETI